MWVPRIKIHEYIYMHVLNILGAINLQKYLIYIGPLLIALQSVVKVGVFESFDKRIIYFSNRISHQLMEQ